MNKAAARLNYSDASLSDAVAKVRSNASPENYAIFGYKGNSTIVLKSTGTTLQGLVAELHDDEISYALLRMQGGRDHGSKAVKFVYIVWLGPGVGDWARGHVGTHSMNLKDLIGWTVLTVQTDDKTELTEDVIRERLKKASGTDFNRGSFSGNPQKACDVANHTAKRHA